MCISDDFKAVQYMVWQIVAKYVPVDSRNKYGETALHVACSTVRQDAVHVARQLVRGGADVNALNRKGETPLHWACSHGAADVTEFLIRHGADVNRATTRERLTPLHVATINHHPQLVSLLLAAGADVKLTDSLERTAVILARFHGYSDVSALLGDVTAPGERCLLHSTVHCSEIFSLINQTNLEMSLSTIYWHPCIYHIIINISQCYANLSQTYFTQS